MRKNNGKVQFSINVLLSFTYFFFDLSSKFAVAYGTLVTTIRFNLLKNSVDCYCSKQFFFTKKSISLNCMYLFIYYVALLQKAFSLLFIKSILKI